MNHLIGYLVAAGATVAVILYLIAAYGAATVTLALNSGPERSAPPDVLLTGGQGDDAARLDAAEFGAFEIAVPDSGTRPGRRVGRYGADPC
jgi:hypothetical protein